LFVLATPVAAFAQAGTLSKLMFDQDGPDLASVNGFVYRFYPDGAAAGQVMSNVSCVVNTTYFTCTTQFPPFTPGAHTLQLTASDPSGTSPESTVLSFTFQVVPTTPRNPRIAENISVAPTAD
jgi:hypothetical protein